MPEKWREFLIIVGLGAVVFFFMRRGGTPAQQQSGQVPTQESAAPSFGPYYLAYNYPKGIQPTQSAPSSARSGAANGNLPVCTACDETILFGSQSAFAQYLTKELSGVYDAYKANILAMTPEWLDQYLVR